MWHKIKYSLLYGAAMTVFGLSAAIYWYRLPVWQLGLLKTFSVREVVNFLNPEGVKVGKITGGQHFEQVRRKLRRQYNFQNVGLHAPIFLEDTLWTTTSDASVEITFEDGSRLQVAPDSMVRIKFEESVTELGIARTPVVQVVKGEVSATATQSLKLADRTGKVSVVSPTTTGVVRSQKIVTAPPSLQVPRTHLRSVASLPPALPKEVPAVKASPALPVSSPVVAKLPTPVKVLPKTPLPPPARVVNASVSVNPVKVAGLAGLASNKFTGEELKAFYMDLSWAPIAAADRYRVVFFGEDGKQILESVETGDNFYRLTKLFQGRRWYQVQSLRGARVLANSEVLPLNFTFAPPELKNPISGATLEADEFKQYFFTWGKTNFTEGYILEVSKTADFSQVLRQESVNNFAKISLVAGRYWWRVRSRHGQELSSPTAGSAFTIQP